MTKLALNFPRAALAALVCMSLGVAVGPARAQAAGHHPLVTAVSDGKSFLGPDMNQAFQRTHDAGARVVRIWVTWYKVAPYAPSKPNGFDATNPADPAYDWSVVDQQVKSAVANGLEPILDLSWAPDWAERSFGGDPFGQPGSRTPDPNEYGQFALAAARRYSGAFQGLPRVRLWQAWNEPNVSVNLSPQFQGVALNQRVPVNARPLAPDIYRPMVNQFAAAVHAVHGDNIVIAGGLAPFARFTPIDQGVAPMAFMRKLLCMSPRNRPLGGCSPVSFDVWSHHPYTMGGPTHHATLADNISLGDLPRMRTLLQAAVRAHHVASRQRVQFWVTEFSWDSRPPDPHALPLRLHARWAAEALYQMWRNGISLVTWFKLRDDPLTGPKRTAYQSGLYFRCEGGLACDRPKPALTAFRFPFVAYREGKRIFVWGRTPAGAQGTVLVQQQKGRSWRRLARLRTDRYGIFTAHLDSSGRGSLRARLAGSAATSQAGTSSSFSLKRPRDRVVPIF